MKINIYTIKRPIFDQKYMLLCKKTISIKFFPTYMLISVTKSNRFYSIVLSKKHVEKILLFMLNTII